MRHPAARSLPALLAVVGVLFLCTGLRVCRPEADPPSWRYVFNTDEGHYSYNTHTKLRYGHWFVDEAKYALGHPLFAFGQYLAALPLKGQKDIVRCRAVSMLCGMASCFVVSCFFRNRRERVAVALLAAVSFMGVVHSRLGIPEMMLALFMQLAALVLIHAYQRNTVLLFSLAGLMAAACVAVKLTGVLMVLVVLGSFVVCSQARRCWRSYLVGVPLGMSVGFLALGLLVVVPQASSWHTMAAAVTSIGRSGISLAPRRALLSLFLFLLSPGMLTMPILWPAALVWCYGVCRQRLSGRPQTVQETVVALWLLAGIGMLGLSSYQPGRWQVLLIPAVLVGGVEFLRGERRRLEIGVTAVLAILMSSVYSALTGGGFLDLTATAPCPAHGLFSHVLLVGAAAVAFAAAYTASGLWTRSVPQRLFMAVVCFEVAVQFEFHAVHTRPTYTRPSQWHQAAQIAEGLAATPNTLLAGDIVQDLALRADIRVLPTFRSFDGPDDLDDRSVRAFFMRNGGPPTHLLLLDSARQQWQRRCPVLWGCLEEACTLRLVIGELGPRDVHIYRVTSTKWVL